MRKRRLLAVLCGLLVTVMLLAAMPLGASALEIYDIWIGDTQITSRNANDVLGDGGSVKYYSSTHRLQLSNPNIPVPADLSTMIFTKIPVTVVGSYHMPSNTGVQFGLAGVADVKLNGNFTFYGNDSAIALNANLEIEAGTLNCYATNEDDDNYGYGIVCYKLTVKNAVNRVELQGVHRATEFTSIELDTCERLITPSSYAIVYLQTSSGTNSYYSIMDLTTGLTPTHAVIGYVDPENYEKYDLCIGNIRVTSLNKNDVLDDGGSIVFDPDTATLTLNNPTIPSAILEGDGFINTDLANITVTGTCHMTSNPLDYGFVSRGSAVTFRGNFTFKGVSADIGSVGDITFDGGTITAIGTGTRGDGVVGEKLTVTDNVVKLDASGPHRAIQYAQLVRGENEWITDPVHHAELPLDSDGGSASYTIIDGSTNDAALQVVIEYVEASTVSSYSIYVGGQQVTSLNMNDVMGDGKVSFNPNGNILTLNDPSLPNCVQTPSTGETFKILAAGIDLVVRGSYTMSETDVSYGMRAANGASLTLDGNFTFHGTESAVMSAGNLVIYGNLAADGRYAIYSGGNTILGGNVTVDNSTYGIYSVGDVMVAGGVTMHAADVALYTKGTLTIAGGGATFDMTGDGQASVVFQGEVLEIPDDYIISLPTNPYVGRNSIFDYDTGSVALHIVIRPKTFAEYLTGSGTESDPYLIETSDDWDRFAKCVNNGNDTAGVYFKQTADVTVGSMVGTAAHCFQGVYLGNGKTLTFNYPDAPAECAPFRFTQNATIRDLHTAGAITTANKFAAGIIAESRDVLLIENCRSSVIIISSVNGDATHGGLIAYCAPGSTTRIYGCIFDGSIIGANTKFCGGFVGYTKGNINIENCLLLSGDFRCSNSQNFTRYGSVNVTLKNCYYFGTQVNDQGMRGYSVTGDEGVTLGFSNVVRTYSLTGITAYMKGVMYNGVFYAGAGESINFTVQASGVNWFYGSTPIYLDAGGSRYFTTMLAADLVVYALRGKYLSEVWGVSYAEGYNNEGADKLFDDDLSSKWCGPRNKLPVTVTFCADDLVRVTGYVLGTAADADRYPGRNPISWRLEGSADGTNWTTLAEETNTASLPGLASVNEAYQLTNASASGYAFFRFTILAVADSTISAFQLSELKLIIDENYTGSAAGDLNGDGEVNVSDVSALLDYIAGATSADYSISGDLDGDGDVNVTDVSALLDIIAGA